MTRVAVGQGEVTVADGVFGAAACGDTVSFQTRHDSRQGHMKFRPDLFIEIYMESILVQNCDFDHTDAYTQIYLIHVNFVNKCIHWIYMIYLNHFNLHDNNKWQLSFSLGTQVKISINSEFI